MLNGSHIAHARAAFSPPFNGDIADLHIQLGAKHNQDVRCGSGHARALRIDAPVGYGAT